MHPWARLHIDYAGPVDGRMFLIVIDAHSKWIDVFCTPTATSKAMIEELRMLFSRFGLPETIVSDNGTFVSMEFEAFLKSNGIRHHTSAPYHSVSNAGSIRDHLAKVLMSYRLTPHGTTEISPVELLLG